MQGGISRATQTANILTPTLRFIGPAQWTCNYATLLLRNAQQLFSIGDGTATGQRFLVMSSPGGPNNETAPASHPANKVGNETNPAGFATANFLHSNPYPYTASPGQPRACAAGNENYIDKKVVIGNPPGLPLTTKTEGIQTGP